MKKTSLLFFLMAICHLFSFSQSYIGKQADKKVQGASYVKINEGNVHPNFIEFRENKGFDIKDIDLWAKKIYNNDLLELELINTSKDQLGEVHNRYQASIDGVPVEFSMFITHSLNDKVQSINGDLPANKPVKNSNTITKQEALQYALNYVNAEVYKWEIESEEQFIKQDRNDQQASFYPEGELVLFPLNRLKGDQQLVYAYKFDVYAHKPISRAYIYINAQNGDILFENKIIHHIDHEGMAHTVYSDTQYIATDSISSGFRLRESDRGNGIETYDMNMGTSYGAAVDFMDDDNEWNNTNTTLDQYATDAHWAAEMTYDYYLNRHNRNSIDGNGFALKSYIHFNLVALGYSNNVNAFWDGERMSYGDGNILSGISPLTTVDICGHEITHGLTTFTANLAYEYESGALNEAFSDILGMSVEFYAKPDAANWVLGEDIGQTFRSLSNPNDHNQPDTYLGDYWHTGSTDNGGVHTNSGVLNHWFYLSTEGGSGTNDNGEDFSVEGIGIEKAEKIAFRTLTVYLTPYSQYADAAFYIKKSAIDLYGVCSAELAAVSNALHAVGLGSSYVDEVNADFSSSTATSCQAPHTVDFTNLSHNSIDFIWDFGDGSTSTEVDPSHTYTEEGFYTVKLIASGDTCGTDSIIMTNLVKIDAAQPCMVIMAENGIAPTQTSCTGMLYDNGGNEGEYLDGENSQITIAPENADYVTLYFNEFDIEAGSGSTCNYDYLEIYDGENRSAPLIGQYCNTTGIPDSIRTTGGAVTLYLHADGWVNGSGFEALWSCNLIETAPTALFSVDETYTCNGQINFTDESTLEPNEWLWDFGDGNTSTEQHPVHTYAENGSYQVVLFASNEFGTDTSSQTTNIEVEYIEEPLVTNDTVCTNEPATLLASGNGTITWYASADSEAILFTGEEFVTDSLSETTIYFAENLNSDFGCVSERVEVYAVVDVCLGVESKASTALFEVYPNPANDKLFIKVNTENSEVVSMQLISIEGKTLIAKRIDANNNEISLSEVPAGLYYCKLELNQSIEVIKVMVGK